MRIGDTVELIGSHVVGEILRSAITSTTCEYVVKFGNRTRTIKANRLRVICGEKVIGGKCDFAPGHEKSSDPVERLHGFRGGR
jgi:hypothetical protein